MKIIVVGLGRMGQRYLRVLRDLYPTNTEIYAVDPTTPSVGDVTAVQSIDQIPSGDFDLGIDCHPNQNRLEVLQNFIDRGIRKVIVEKPLAASWSEALAINSLAKQHRVHIFSPFYNRYAEHFSHHSFSALDAGNLLTVSISGGALGLGCNGIHYIDLCNYFFNSNPSNIFSTLSTNSLTSPRGEKFRDHGGLVVLQYPKGRASIDFSSESYMGICLHLVFERGRILIHDQLNPQWFWYRQPDELRGQPLYRTSNEIPVAPPISYGAGIESLMKLALPIFLTGSSETPGVTEGLNALKAIGLAMASNTVRRTVGWNEEQLLENMTFSFT